VPDGDPPPPPPTSKTPTLFAAGFAVYVPVRPVALVLVGLTPHTITQPPSPPAPEDAAEILPSASTVIDLQLCKNLL
jgi:hypothetical protein